MHGFLAVLRLKSRACFLFLRHFSICCVMVRLVLLWQRLAGLWICKSYLDKTRLRVFANACMCVYRVLDSFADSDSFTLSYSSFRCVVSSVAAHPDFGCPNPHFNSVINFVPFQVFLLCVFVQPSSSQATHFCSQFCMKFKNVLFAFFLETRRRIFHNFSISLCLFSNSF